MYIFFRRCPQQTNLLHITCVHYVNRQHNFIRVDHNTLYQNKIGTEQIQTNRYQSEKI